MAEVASTDGAADAQSGNAASEMADSSVSDGAMEDASAEENGGVMSWLVWIILAIAVILIIGVALVIMSARKATID